MSCNGVDEFAQLALALGCYCVLLDDMHQSSDCIYAARKMLRIVLAFAADIDIQSMPGNEIDRIYELQTHCIYVEGLLAKATVDTQVIRAECREAIGQLCYLLQLLSIPWATVVETLCPEEEERWTTTSAPLQY